jgi:hypothetical protein
MAAWRATAGATLLMPSGADGDHLYIVLNEPKQFPGYGSQPCVVFVNVSTARQGVRHDETCLLSAGCHLFVKQDSYVVYRSARIERVSHVQRLVQQGVFKPHTPFEEGLLAVIKVGLRSSPFATREFKNLPI